MTTKPKWIRPYQGPFTLNIATAIMKDLEKLTDGEGNKMFPRIFIRKRKVKEVYDVFYKNE